MRKLLRPYWKILLLIQIAIAGDLVYCLWMMSRALYTDIGHWLIIALVSVLVMAGETWRDRHAP